MAKFDSSRVDKIEFDFTSPEDFRPSPDAPGVWVGVVPEPSQDMLLEFFAAYADLQLEAQATEERLIEEMDAEARDKWRAAHAGDILPAGEESKPLTDAELDLKLATETTAATTRARMQRLLTVRSEARQYRAERLNEAVATFCSNTPDTLALGALPFRVVDGFIGWLTGFFSPEALAAATQK